MAADRALCIEASFAHFTMLLNSEKNQEALEEEHAKETIYHYDCDDPFHGAGEHFRLCGILDRRQRDSSRIFTHLGTRAHFCGQGVGLLCRSGPRCSAVPVPEQC